LLPSLDDREPKAKKLVKESEELIRDRDRANHDFMGALAGGG